MAPRHLSEDDTINATEPPYARHARQDREKILELLLATSAVSQLDRESLEGKIVHEALAEWARRKTPISLRGALATVCRLHEPCAKVTLECRKTLIKAWHQAHTRTA